MNLRFLGDALDHWKGSVFEGLQSSNVLEDFRVDAMASDIENWRHEDWSLFAKLVRVDESHIVQHEATLNRNHRGKYFDEISHSGDLFLDPDTGIRTGSVKDPKQYLNPDELFSLMSYEPRRVVAVYQHVRAMRTRERCEAVLRVLRSAQSKPFYCVSYDSGNVTLIFLIFQQQRIKSVQKYFRDFLGSHADNRIGLWV
jgi:hypothetical protein